MEITELELESFAQSDLKSYDLSEFPVDKKQSTSFLKAELAKNIEDLNCLETMNSRLSFFNIPGVLLDDYSERYFDLGDGKAVICGVRHEGGNVEMPFVQITPNFKIEHGDQLVDLYNVHLQNFFLMFQPKCLRVWSPEKISRCQLGSTYLVSTREKFEGISEWPSESWLILENICDDTYYEWYKRGYEAFHSENLELKYKVTVNRKSTMQSSICDGLLKAIMLDGDRIGVIAAERSDFLGLGGIYFNEIFLSKEFKGKGYAKAAQRKFVLECSRQGDYVWGTIDFQNLPSYKTAIANGRVPIRFECFVDI